MAAAHSLYGRELEQLLPDVPAGALRDTMAGIVESSRHLADRSMRVTEHHVRNAEYVIKRDGYPTQDLGQQDRAWRDLNCNVFATVPNTAALITQACDSGRDFVYSRDSRRDRDARDRAGGAGGGGASGGGGRN